MNRQTQIIIVALVAIVVGLGITVGVMAAGDDGDETGPMSGHMGGDDAYAGMMGAMAGMDSDDMLDHMRDVLGEDGYQRMLAHFAEHRDGGPMTGSPAVDEMMHSMMDGMMQHMPADADNIMPPGRDEHHQTPAAGSPP